MSWAEMNVQRAATRSARRMLSCDGSMRPRVSQEICRWRQSVSTNYHAPSSHCLHTTPPQPSSAWHVAPPRPPTVSATDVAEPARDLTERTRLLMRLLPSSVVVCTATAPSTNPSTPPAARAMTVSSLTSVSLGSGHKNADGTPAHLPVVSFNVKAPSHTLAALAATRRFNVHVLAADPAGAAVAHRFTQGWPEGRASADVLRALRDEMGCMAVIPGSGDSRDAPLLQGSGVLYAMRCRLLADNASEETAELGEAEAVSERDALGVRAIAPPQDSMVRVRDHVIVFGEVMDVVEGNPESLSSTDLGQVPSFGLAYADGQYRQLGQSIAPGPRRSIKT